MSNQTQRINSNIDNNEYVRINAKMPMALAVLLAFNLLVGVWAVSSFYTYNQDTRESFQKNFNRIELELAKINLNMYPRKEAQILNEIAKETNSRQDIEIRQLIRDISKLRSHENDHSEGKI